MSKLIRRKPKPQPPNWYWNSTDGCWGCKNRNNCGNCKWLKKQRDSEIRKRKRKEKIVIVEN